MAEQSFDFEAFVDEECHAEEWWDAAHDHVGPFAEDVRALARGERLLLTADARDQLLSWAKRLPGWAPGPDHARHPLIIVERRVTVDLGAVEPDRESVAVARGRAVLAALEKAGSALLDTDGTDGDQAEWSEMVQYLGRRGVEVKYDHDAGYPVACKS